MTRFTVQIVHKDDFYFFKYFLDTDIFCGIFSLLLFFFFFFLYLRKRRNAFDSFILPSCTDMTRRVDHTH